MGVFGGSPRVRWWHLDLPLVVQHAEAARAAWVYVFFRFYGLLLKHGMFGTCTHFPQEFHKNFWGVTHFNIDRCIDGCSSTS